MEAFFSALGLACLGIGIGLLSGLLGVGGGTIMVPVFRLILHMDPLTSTATSLFTVVPTSASGAITHWRNKTCLLPIGIAAGLGGALMSPIGVRLAHISPAWLVMAAAAAVIVWSAVKMFSKALKKPSGASAKSSLGSSATEESAAQGLQQAVVAVGSGVDSSGLIDTPTSQRTFVAKDIVKAVLIGLLAGLASGYVGVGGGFLMVSLFITVYQLSMHQASGTSLVAVMILAIPGIIQQAMFGTIDYLAGICIAAGSIPGAYWGAKLSKRIPEKQLRLIFGCFLLVAAVLLVVNEIA